MEHGLNRSCFEMNTITKLSFFAAAIAALAPRVALADDDIWHPTQHRPVATFGAELGLGHYVEGSPFGFDSGTGSVTQTGPVWGLRAGVDFLSWIGVEGRYVGMWNSGSSRASGLGYVMTGGELVLRLVVPTPYVRPYVFGGIGYYDFARVGTDVTGASALVSSSQPGVPMGVGLEVPIARRWSIAVEGTFRFQIGESFAPSNEDIDGADQTTLSGILKLRL